MSDNPSNFASTLASGIQDVAALLPLLGTDQCERHAGDTLAKGYLYAAILPVSIFGSLGIVKAAFAVFLATITYPFFGGLWLDDAGFSTPSSVSSMITITKDTGRYGAEIAVEKLLKEQNIEDASLVKNFDFSDKHATKAERSSVKTLAVNAAGEGDKEEHDRIKYQELAECCYVVTVMEYHAGHLLFNDLEWQKIKQKYHVEDTTNLAEQLVLEQRIRNRLHPQVSPSNFLHRLLPKPCSAFSDRSWERPTDPENAGQVPERLCLSGAGHTQEYSADTRKEGKGPQSLQLNGDERRALEELLAPDWIIVLYQLVLAVGMGMVVTGYVGCFSLVGQTKVENAPYVWFGLETALSLLRIFVWGSNPKWDDGTGLSMSLQLHEMREPNDSADHFLHITSPYSYSHLRIFENDEDDALPPQAFIAYDEENFLGMVTPWLGPLQPLGSGAVRLFYSILFQGDRKSLYTTVYFTDSRPTLTFSVNDLNSIFSSTFETNPITRAVQVTILDRVFKHVDSFIESSLHHQIVDHCQRLSTRLFRRQRIHSVTIKWNIPSLPFPDNVASCESNAVTSEPLSEYDQTYLTLREAWTAKWRYCLAREALLEEFMNDNEYCQKHVSWDIPASFYGEVLFISESLILELQLWHEGTVLATSMGPGLFSRQMLPEYIRAMHSRMSVEAKKAVERYGRYKWRDRNDAEELTRYWDGIQTTLLQLNESLVIQTAVCNTRQHVASILSFVKLESVNDLGKRLNSLISGRWLDGWLEQCANIAAKTTLIVESTPTPEQKLAAILRLWIIRLQKILSSGFSIARTDTTLWNTFLRVPDSTAWDPYYTLEALSTLAGSHRVLELDATLPVSLLDGEMGPEDGEISWGQDLNSGGLGQREERSVVNEGQGQEKAAASTHKILWKILGSDKLTTLVLNNDMNDETSAVITKCIKSTPNIICLAGIQCHHPGEDCKEQRCQSVFANRQAWKMKVQEDKESFTYRVGFAARDRGDVQLSVKGNHVRLRDTGTCFALFYCPHTGTLDVSFNVYRRLNPFEIVAELVSDVDEGEAHETVMYEVSAGQKEEESEHVKLSFSNVPKGTGSVSMKNWFWKIHGLVKLEWVPRVGSVTNQAGE
ncbi:hypothetical protein VNI00_012491 [Paramarasmius palmivorus]|uniref:Uncharacterized protein n=1 Tax=Paramarasmius palmivorus TaxID=297713 RepID=A0AAW0C5N8_9AGAR